MSQINLWSRMTEKILTSGLILILLLTCEPAASVQLESKAMFDWLTGSWLRETAKSITTESWQRLSSNHFQGKSVRVSKTTQDTVFTESLLLSKMSGKWYYFAKVEENRFPVPFELRSTADNYYIFENPQHDFPKQITYQQQSDSNMTVTVSNPTDSTSNPIVFRFRRQ